MLGTELSYVRQQLLLLTPAGRKIVAELLHLHPKTLNRLANKQTKGRGDTLGKIAMYFRTKEKRNSS